MPRISITFYNDVFKQLRESAEQKQIPISHYVRHLVDIGSQLEEAVDKKRNDASSKVSEISELGDLKKLWENDLCWLLESLHLIRYLIRNLVQDKNLSIEDNKNYTDDIISKAKEKAQSYVNGLLSKKI